MGIVSHDERSEVAEASFPREFVTYFWIVLGLWGASLLDAAIAMSKVSPRAAFYRLAMVDEGVDLTGDMDRFHLLHQAKFFSKPGWDYPAPCALLYRLLYGVSWGVHVGKEAAAFYFLVVASLLLIAGSLFAKALSRRGLPIKKARIFVASSIAVSWPIYFALERGNIEAILWLGAACAIYAYVGRHWMVAAVLVGLVASFKLYPILFFALFLRPKKYREIVVGVLSAVMMTLLSLFYLGPTVRIAAVSTLAGVRAFVRDYSSIYNPIAIGYDHSAFSLIKILDVHHQEWIPRQLGPYTIVAGLIAAVIFFAFTIRMPRPNQLLMLSTVTVLLPSTSFDYTLQSLYIPWAWLCLLIVSAHRAHRRIPGAMAAMVCFALLLAPETFLHHSNVLFAGQIKSIVLMALIAISIKFRFEESEDLPTQLAQAA